MVKKLLRVLSGYIPTIYSISIYTVYKFEEKTTVP